MLVPPPERKKHHPSSTNQDESNDGDRQSRNPQHQISGGTHSNQKEYAEKVVHPNSSNGQGSRNPQARTHPEQQWTFSEVIPKPEQFPQFPTHQQQPKQSIPVTPPRNNPAGRQEPQPINLAIVIHPPPQNTGNLPSQNLLRPDDTTHKQPQSIPNKPGPASSSPPEYPPPSSTYNKHPDKGTAHEQPTLKKPGQAPGSQPWHPPPENKIPTHIEPSDEKTARKQPILKKTGEAPGPSIPTPTLPADVGKEQPSEGLPPFEQKPPPAAVASNGGNNSLALNRSSSLDPTHPVVTVYPVQKYDLPKHQKQDSSNCCPCCCKDSSNCCPYCFKDSSNCCPCCCIM